MNYWNLYKKPEDTWRERLQRVVFAFVNVQSAQRHPVQSVLIGINYILTYVIIFFLMMQSLARQFTNIQPPPSTEQLQIQQINQSRLSTTPIPNHYFQLISILFLVRVGIAILYIITQKVYILMIDKLLLMVNIFLVEYESTGEDFIQIEMPLFIVEVLALGVWAYKIQRRIKFFDSRLHFRYPFVKEFVVYFMALLVRRVQKMTFIPMVLTHGFAGMVQRSGILTLNELQMLIIFVLCFAMIILTDLSDALYNSRFKRFILTMDSILIILLISWVALHIVFSQTFTFYYYLSLLIVMIVLMVFGLVGNNSFKLLYSVQARFLQYQSEDWLLDYFQTLRRLIQMQGLAHRQANHQMINFIEFHRSSCLYTACPLTQRFNIQDPVEIKAQLINEYMIKDIQQLMPTKPVLKKYLIHYLSPKDKVYRYLNSSAQSIDKKKAIQKQQYVKRQLWRLTSQKKNMTTEIKILQAQVVKTQILQIMTEYLISAKRFYSILSKDRINADNVLIYGNRMLELIQKVEFLKENNSANFTQGVRVVINNFTTRLTQYPKSDILDTVIDPPFLIHKTTESCPTLLLSAQPENFLAIIDTNIACTKEFYLTRDVFVTLNAMDLIPQQIRVLHMVYFQRVSKKIQFDGVKNFPIALFTFNSLGYATFFIGDVYSFYSIKGRIWCVAIDVIYRLKSIVLIAKQGNKGKVIGISEMAVFHGFTLADKGKYFTNELLASLLTKKQATQKYKRVVVEAYEKIFDQCQFYFMDTKTMQITQQNTAFGLTYYLVEIYSTSDDRRFGTGSKSSLSKSSLSDLKSTLTVSEKESKYVPKFQFFYHSDGVVRLYPQKTQDIIYNFSKYFAAQRTEQMEIGGQLGENIVEMRLMRDELDFLENIDQEQEFMSKPLTKLEKKANQLSQFSMKQQFFKQCLTTRQQSLPKWLFYTRLFFILSSIIFLFGLIFIYIQTTLMITTIDTQSHIISLIANNELQLIKLSKLMLGYKYYATGYLLNVTIQDAILNATRQYEVNSKMINSLDASVSSYFSAGKLQNVLSQYFISFNNLSMMANTNTSYIKQFDQQAVLLSVTQDIIPAFQTIISQKSTAFLSTLQSTIWLNMIIMLLLDVITLAVWIWVVGVERHVDKIKSKFLWLMSKINDKFIDKQLIKVLLFQQYLHFDKDIYCEDDLDYIMDTRRHRQSQKLQLNQQLDNNNKSGQKKKRVSFKRRKASQTYDQESQLISQSTQRISSQKKITVVDGNSNAVSSQNKDDDMLEDNMYIKTIISHNRISVNVIVALIWTLVIGALNYFFFNSISQFATLSQKYTLLQQNLDQIQSTSDTIWLVLNIFPNNLSLIRQHMHHMYQVEREFKFGMVDINRHGGFDSSGEFIQLMQHIWHDNCCDYIDNVTPNCRAELNGALTQGANQIIAYQYRAFDYFVYINYTAKDTHQSPYTMIVSNIQIFYFAQVRELVTNLIFQQHHLQRDKYQRVFFGYFIGIVICFYIIGVIYKLVSRENYACIRVEELFKLFQFDTLKNNKEFKLYVKQNYYDKIFK